MDMSPRMFRPVRLLTLAVLGSIALTSCSGEGSDTIVLSTTSPSSPNAVIPDAVIPSYIQSELKEHSTINEGSNPPNIAGCYLISPMKLMYSNIHSDSIGKVYTPMTVCFTKKNGTNLYSYTETEGNQSGASDSVHVIGKGSDFTAYFTTTGISSGVANKEAIIISGTKNSDGIRNLEYSFTMLSKDPDLSGKLVDVGAIRSFFDGDRLSSSVTRTTRQLRSDAFDGVFSDINGR